MRSTAINTFYLCLLSTACSQTQKTEEEANVAPVLDSIEIIPGTGVTTSTELLCRATASDENDDQLELSYSWTNEAGDVLSEGIYLQLTPETTSPGDAIYCNATITDGRSDAVQSSASINVENTNPTVDTVNISPDQDVKADSALSCSATGSDADGQDLDWAYTWSNDGTDLGEGSEITLTADDVDAGDTVTCTATATDTSGDSVSDEASVTVENSRPIIGSLGITPDDPRVNDTLSCAADGIVDIDDDTVNITYAWTIDGTEAGEGTDTLTGPFSFDSHIECTATPNDGTTNGDSVSTSVVIGNTTPTVDSVVITPDTGVEANTLLQCSQTTTDVDGDTLVETYEWTDGLGNQLGSGDSLQLSAGIIGVGDEVICTATADDGVVSASNAASVFIDNTAPEVSLAASITATPDATTGGALLCSAGIDDLNDGTLAPNYEWTNAAGNVIGSDATYTINAAETNPGESVTCTASASDYQGLSASSSASINIVNTTPEITAAATITADPDATTGSLLTCDAAFSDIDDGALTTSYEWTNAAGDVISSNATYTIDAAETNPEETVTCTATGTDAQNESITSAASIDIVNTTPEITSAATITADPDATTGSLLTCDAAFSDIDDGALTTSYEWTNAAGDVIGSNATYTIDAAETNPEEAVTCTATGTDAQNESITSAASIDIVNTTPEITSAATVTADPDTTTGSVLTCDAAFSDIDDGALTTSYEWTNAAGDVIGSNATYTIDAAETNPEEVVTCTASATDAQGTSISSAASIDITNTAPEISAAATITATPDTATGSTLTCDASFTDLDDGALSSTYEWTNAAGDVIGTAADYVINASETEPGESLTCTATGTDGQSASIDSTASATVVNTAPAAPSISIAGGNGFVAEDNLVCNVDIAAADVDEQAVFYVYEWTDAAGNTVAMSAETTALNNTLSASASGLGDWTCTVYATDGTAMSASVSATFTLDYAINARSPGDLFITELMQNPDIVSDSSGEWFEIYNETPEDINLLGLVIADTGHSTTVDQSVVVPAGGYAVLGNNADASTNGGITVDYEYSSVSLNNSGDQFLSIANANGDLDVVTWGDAASMYTPDGASMTLSIDAYSDTDNDDMLYWCESTTEMPNGDRGTPGAENETCDFDNDGAYFAEDCDDEDNMSTIIADDADCDGVLTADDCDDSDSSVLECVYVSCLDILTSGAASGDGVYEIDPDSNGLIEVYCDMSTAGGGWTLLATNGREGVYSGSNFNGAMTGSYWDESTIFGDAAYGPVSITNSHRNIAFSTLLFTDLMFDNGNMFAEYEGVGDGTEDFHSFQMNIPLDNCGLNSSHEWTMTDGNLSSPDLCNTNLYINPADYEGSSSCPNNGDMGGRGPTWSHANNGGCHLDDAYYYTFTAADHTGFSQSAGPGGGPAAPIAWGLSEPIRMWAR